MRYLFMLLLIGCSLFSMEDSNQAFGPLLKAIKAGDSERVLKLRSEGHNPSAYRRNEPMFFALGLVDQKKREKMVKLLLEQGVDPNGFVGEYRIDRNYLTLLGRAVYLGHPDAVACLLAYDADPNGQDRTGSPALHLAAAGYRITSRYYYDQNPNLVKNAEKILDLLLLSGAKPELLDSSGFDAANELADANSPWQEVFRDFGAYRQKKSAYFDNLQASLDVLRQERSLKRLIKRYGHIQVATFRDCLSYLTPLRRTSDGYETPPDEERTREVPRAPRKPPAKSRSEELFKLAGKRNKDGDEVSGDERDLALSDDRSAKRNRVE